MTDHEQDGDRRKGWRALILPHAVISAIILAFALSTAPVSAQGTALETPPNPTNRPFANSEAVIGPTEIDPSRGPVLWRKCRACHTLEQGERHRAGPNLHGFFGRSAAQADGYVYSPALSGAGIVWTESTLDAYLKATQEFVPGSKMYGGLAIERDRRDLIAWLKDVTGAK